MKVHLTTLGCPKNQVDSELMLGLLTEAGFPVTEATLATKATRGGGPPFQKFGSRALYRWADALLWAGRAWNANAHVRGFGALLRIIRSSPFYRTFATRF